MATLDDDPSVADLTMLFAPHIALPSQFLAPRSVHSPEKALMLAVLECAWTDAVSHQGVAAARKLRGAARHWIADEDTRWPYSFLRLCDAVGMSAQAFRQAVADSDVHPVLRRKRSSTHGGTQPQPLTYTKLR